MVRKHHKRTCSSIDALHKELEKLLYFSGESSNVDFLVSSLIDQSPFCTMEELVHWLHNMNSIEYFQVEEIPLSELRGWKIDPYTGDISHETGGFFSITGMSVVTDVGPVREWSQPIINQPEIGVLGIITKKINGVLYFLMQAKAEPGNINAFQLSPTVQATRSNFTRLHGGKPIKYLEYFLEPGRAEILIDQLQSEQGSRFYKKRNRNIIVRVNDDIPVEVDGNYRWLTLGQIKKLLQHDNMVNMDTRSVISCISYIPCNLNSSEQVKEYDLYNCLKSNELVTHMVNEFDIKYIVSSHYNTPSMHSIDYLLHKVTDNKFRYSLDVKLIPLNNIEMWDVTPNEISHVENKYFSVIGVRVHTSGREVRSWDQPIIKQVDAGIVGLVISEINGVLHFLVQLKTESGSMDILDIAPTVQCITGSYQTDNRPMFVEQFLDTIKENIIYDTKQSEEGGRFYHESNRNMLINIDQPFYIKEPERYLWMTLKQLKNFVRYNNYVNVEARSLLSFI